MKKTTPGKKLNVVLKAVLPLLILLSVQAAARAQGATTKEQQCFNMVQNKVAYNRAGNNSWNPQNINRLCAGTTDPAATIACFQNLINQTNNYEIGIQNCAVSQPGNTTKSLNGNWAGIFADGSQSNYVWRIAQNGSQLSFEDIGAGTGAKFSGQMSGNRITDGSGKTGILDTLGNQIKWSDGVIWKRQVAPNKPAGNQINGITGSENLVPAQDRQNSDALKAAFKQAIADTKNAKYTEIDGPRKDAAGSGALAVENHINGMALIGDWYVVNYPNSGREEGRLLFWNKSNGEWADVKTFKMASKNNNGGNGFPACMDADGNLLVVGTGDSGFLKFFDFSNPGSGVSELPQLEVNVGGLIEDVGLAFDPEINKYLLFAENKFWVSVGNSGRSITSTTGWQSVNVNGDKIPHGEAGSPMRYLGSGTFAILSLGSDESNDSYAFRLSFVTLSGTNTSYQADRELVSEAYTFANPGEAGGAPSFRWGGTASLQNSGGNFILDLYAAPKRLDASGNYYVWSGSNRKADYQFQFKTADAQGAGTDANISLKICGDKGCTAAQVINPLISGNAFERNQTDTFTLRNQPDVGIPSFIEIQSDTEANFINGAAWDLEWVTVSKDGHSYTFRINTEIKDTNVHRFNLN